MLNARGAQSADRPVLSEKGEQEGNVGGAITEGSDPMGHCGQGKAVGFYLE